LTQPGEVVTQFSYDNKGQSTALTDARDNKTQTIKDDFGRVVQHISPDTGTNLYAYDKAGNRIKRTDPEGTVTTYQWNKANKLTRKESTRKDGNTELTTFSYDQATGKLASTTNPNTTESFKYNQEGQLTDHKREIDGHSFTTQYEYNEQDRLKKKHLPDGQTLRYLYYAKGDVNNENNQQTGKLRAITRESLFGLKQENIIAEIDNDKTDNQTSYLSHNGLKTNYEFREDRQLKNIQIADTLKLQYSYDQNGNITGIDENGTLQNYAYDQGRLTFADTLTGTYAYNYDKVGNRTDKIHENKKGKTTTENYTYPENGEGNRLTSLVLRFCFTV
jgi:YD repeat-containing protein